MYSRLRAIGLSFLLVLICNASYAERSLQNISGKVINFSSLNGKWVFINYWASWCQSCIDEIPELNGFYQSHKKDPVALFAVNYDALPIVAQKKLIKEFGILYPSLGEDPASTLKLGDITGVPVTFIFNPKGKLVETLYGEQTQTTLNKVLK